MDNANNLFHRGGEEVLLDVGGQDATEAFEDVGHSDEAREILDGLLVGTLKRGVRFSSFHLSLSQQLHIVTFGPITRELYSYQSLHFPPSQWRRRCLWSILLGWQLTYCNSQMTQHQKPKPRLPHPRRLPLPVMLV